MQKVTNRFSGRQGVTTSTVEGTGVVRVRWTDNGESYRVSTDDLVFNGPTDETRALEGQSLEAIIARANGRT